MTNEKALETLKHYQNWRRGLGSDMPMLSPINVGLALDVAIKVMKLQAKKPKAEAK